MLGLVVRHVLVCVEDARIPTPPVMLLLRSASQYWLHAARLIRLQRCASSSVPLLHAAMLLVITLQGPTCCSSTLAAAAAARRRHHLLCAAQVRLWPVVGERRRGKGRLPGGCSREAGGQQRRRQAQRLLQVSGCCWAGVGVGRPRAAPGASHRRGAGHTHLPATGCKSKAPESLPSLKPHSRPPTSQTLPPPCLLTPLTLPLPPRYKRIANWGHTGHTLVALVTEVQRDRLGGAREFLIRRPNARNGLTQTLIELRENYERIKDKVGRELCACLCCCSAAAVL